MRRGGGVRVEVEEELEVVVKMEKKSRGVRVDTCERRIEVIVTMQRKSGGPGVRWGEGFQSVGGQGICERRICHYENTKYIGVRGSSGGGGGRGGQSACVRRIEVVKMPKKSGSGRGVRSRDQGGCVR